MHAGPAPPARELAHDPRRAPVHGELRGRFVGFISTTAALGPRPARPRPWGACGSAALQLAARARRGGARRRSAARLRGQPRRARTSPATESAGTLGTGALRGSRRSDSPAESAAPLQSPRSSCRRDRNANATAARARPRARCRTPARGRGSIVVGVRSPWDSPPEVTDQRRPRAPVGAGFVREPEAGSSSRAPDRPSSRRRWRCSSGIDLRLRVAQLDRTLRPGDVTSRVFEMWWRWERLAKASASSGPGGRDSRIVTASGSTASPRRWPT